MLALLSRTERDPEVPVQSVKTRGREQVEVEHGDAARGEQEGEHDRGVRSLKSCRALVLEDTRGVDALGHDVLLTSSLAPTGNRPRASGRLCRKGRERLSGETARNRVG